MVVVKLDISTKNHIAMSIAHIIKIVDSELYFLFSLFTLFSIFRTTRVRVDWSHCHISTT